MEMDLKVVAHAKEYIDDLARGINPLTKEEVMENDVVNQVRISRCLYYVSDVLEAVLHNGGVRVILEEQPFVPENMDLSLFVPEEQAMSVSVLVGKINELKPPAMKKLKVTAVTNWLAAHGFLRVETSNGKNRKRPTQQGFNVGILEREKLNEQGIKYCTVLYSPQAQQFVMDNLTAIVDEGYNESVGKSGI